VVARSNPTLKVLDSYSDATKNHYLINVGSIEKTYISTILRAHYNGLIPISLSRTTVTESIVANSITESVSKSITTSDTQNHTVGIEGAWAKRFPIAGKFSVKLKYEWTGSWTNSETNTQMIETSYSTIERFLDSNTTSFTVGEHGEPAGHYRYASYDVCDVYFVVSTSLDNSQLLSWDTVVSARGDLFPNMEYSVDGVFDNAPIAGSEINFADDFYKNLPIPPKSIEEHPVPEIKISSSIPVYDGDSIKITDAQQSHTFNRPIGLDIEALKKLGYTKITIAMDIEIRAHDKGSGRKIWLDIDGSPVWRVDNLNVDWQSWKTVKYTQVVDITTLKDSSVFRFGFATNDNDWIFGASEWWFNSANLTFSATR
jgi:hypothetical protein